MNLRDRIGEIVRQCRQSIGILERFYLSKGRISKIVENKQGSIPPLIQRLDLQPIPNWLTDLQVSYFVLNQIRRQFPKKVSRRVVRKISRHYGVDLYGRGFFKAIPDKPNMLWVKPRETAVA